MKSGYASIRFYLKLWKKQMTDLLTPRFKVILSYPKSPFEVGKIITLVTAAHEKALQYRWTECDGVYSEYQSFFEDFPAVFEPLKWWRERTEIEMPPFLKTKNAEEVREVIRHFAGSNLKFLYKSKIDRRYKRSLYENYLPATIDEYNDYIN